MAKSDKLAQLVVELRADNAQLRSDFNKAAQQANNFQRQINGQLSGMRKSFKKTGDGFSSIFKKVAVAAIVKETAQSMVAFTVEIAKAADKVNLLSARVQAFSNDSRGFQKVFETAQKLGVSIEDAGAGVARFLVVGKDLGITVNEAQKLFTTFTQLARVGGASGAESSAAFIQLTQALGAGVLRGQELNSILEQAPLVAQAIAKELGVSVGQLKTLGEQGKISAEVVRSALVNAATEAGIQFEKLPETLEQQQTKLSNAWTVLLANLDKRLQASDIFRFFNRRLTEAVQAAANRLSDDPVTLLRQEVEDLNAEIRRIEAVPMGARSTDMQERLADFRRKLNERVAPLLAEYEATIAATERADAPKPAATVASDPMRGLAEVAVSAARVSTTAMQQLFDDLESKTRTSLQRTQQEYAQFIVELEELRAQGRISSEEFDIRLESFLAQQLEEVTVTSQKIGDAMSPISKMYEEMLAEVRSATETELEATERRIFEFSLKVKELIGAGLISAEEGQEFIQRFVDQQEKPFDQLEEFGKQAARNIQTAFADFLFDPFSNGLKGMLKGFLDTIRRMVAEVAAQQILTALFGGLTGSSNSFLSGLGKAFGGGKAIGGQVLASQAYLVGEKGPELLVGAAGKVIPGTDMGGGGNVTIAPVFNVDARGATQELAKQLPAILAEQARRTVELARAAINDDISRGALGRA